MSNIEKKLRKYTLSDLIEHLENLGYSNQEIDLFIELMVLEVKDFKRWNKLEPYDITFNPRVLEWTCTCPGYRFRNKCKHIKHFQEKKLWLLKR